MRRRLKQGLLAMPAPASRLHGSTGDGGGLQLGGAAAAATSSRLLTAADSFGSPGAVPGLTAGAGRPAGGAAGGGGGNGSPLRLKPLR